MKLIHITDIHLMKDGSALFGLDPLFRLKQCFDSIIKEHSDADMCVITGDLANSGCYDAYVQLKAQIARMPMPVSLIIGNHDSRENFLKCFNDKETDPNGFIQYEKSLGHYRGLFLDTNDYGVHHGVYCQKRAEWLKAKLAEDTSKPVVLFMHHPFFELGIPSMDQIPLKDTQYLMDAIAGHESQIRHIFFGHIHRPISGQWKGISFSTVRGTNHQVPLDMKTADIIYGSHDMPQYGVVLLKEDRIIVHPHDFLTKATQFELGSPLMKKLENDG